MVERPGYRPVLRGNATGLGLRRESLRALLHLLNNDLAAAAALLGAAAPLGWSDGQHPGHLLFPLFAQWLGCASATAGELLSNLKHYCHKPDDYAAPGQAQLESATVEELVCALGRMDIDASDRQLVVSAMRKAAEGRCRAVTAKQRRRTYGHAAALVAACAEVDGENGQRWAAAIRALYRRYPAFRRELDQRLGNIG